MPNMIQVDRKKFETFMGILFTEYLTPAESYDIMLRVNEAHAVPEQETKFASPIRTMVGEVEALMAPA